MIGRLYQYQLDQENFLTRQLKTTMSLAEIRKSGLIEEILEKQPNVLSIVLYGSVSTGKDTMKSDIDLLIISTNKLKIGYKFGLEFLNSKNGRSFISKLKNKIIFADLKINDIPNTCIATIKSLKDLKLSYLTIHISSGLEALKAVKKNSGKTKIVGVTTLTSLNNKSLTDEEINNNIMSTIKINGHKKQ